MPRRLTISTLLALVALAGAALAALRSSSGLWLLATFLATLLVVLTSTLGAVLARGPRRTTWLGVAIFGWGYYLVSGQVPFASGSSHLEAGISALFNELHPATPMPPAPGPPTANNATAYGQWNRNNERLEKERRSLSTRFHGIMNASLGLSFALAGGDRGPSLLGEGASGRAPARAARV